MVFSSTIFLFFFLPLTLLAYFVVGPRGRNLILLAASLLFYAWGETVYLLVMLFSIAANYLFGLLIDRARERGSRGGTAFALAVATNLGLLGFFKYANFFVDNLNQVLPVLGLAPMDIGRVHLPIGISFFTFQALSYVVDVYRRRVMPARSWIDFANYLAFFPQLVAGPIVRASDLVPQMEEMPGRDRPIEAARATFLVLVGLFKKTVVANWLASRLADPVFAWPEIYSGPDVLMGVYAYALQIYCDFSAYSDIAIGTALLMGFHFPDNFNAPYYATTLQDFWRRWHISLSSWLRDYLYIPLGGSRQGERRTYVNLFVTFLLGGMWHGAAWTFILWGAFHGFYLSVERKVRQWLGIPEKGAPPAHWAIALAGRVWIFHVVCFSWILFRGGTVETVGSILGAIGAWRSGVPEISFWKLLPIAMVAIGFATQFFDGGNLWKLSRKLSGWPAWTLALLAAVLLTAILALGPEGVAPFIYFQF